MAYNKQQLEITKRAIQNTLLPNFDPDQPLVKQLNKLINNLFEVISKTNPELGFLFNAYYNGPIPEMNIILAWCKEHNIHFSDAFFLSEIGHSIKTAQDGSQEIVFDPRKHFIDASDASDASDTLDDELMEAGASYLPGYSPNLPDYWPKPHHQLARVMPDTNEDSDDEIDEELPNRPVTPPMDIPSATPRRYR